MERAVNEFSNTEKKRVAQLKASSMQGIMKEINGKVTEHAEKQGFDFDYWWFHLKQSRVHHLIAEHSDQTDDPHTH